MLGSQGDLLIWLYSTNSELIPEDDVELEGDAMPDNSHVSRTDAEVKGVAIRYFAAVTPI